MVAVSFVLFVSLPCLDRSRLLKVSRLLAAGAIVNLCLGGFVAAIRITSLLNMGMLRNTFVTSVCRCVASLHHRLERADSVLAQCWLGIVQAARFMLCWFCAMQALLLC